MYWIARSRLRQGFDEAMSAWHAEALAEAASRAMAPESRGARGSFRASSLVLNLPLVGLWVRLLAIPQSWLYAGMLVFATTGTIAAKPSVVELSTLAAFGVMGVLMRRFDFPIVPVVLRRFKANDDEAAARHCQTFV